MLRLILLLSLVLSPVRAAATADGPDSWRVTGVAASDTLSVRAGPAVSYPRLGRLAHNARGLHTIVCVPTLSMNAYNSLSAPERRAVDGMARWCLVAQGGREVGWVNARFLAEGGGEDAYQSGQNVGGGGQFLQSQHNQICATQPQVNVSLNDANLWRLPNGQRAVDVVQNRSPNWDSGMRWLSAWPDAGRGFAKGETSYDFSVQFCSCGSQPARYEISRIRVDDRAEVYFDGTNWQDIAVNFRADQPVARAGKSHVQDFNRSLMLRIHNDPGTPDNPLGFAIEGRLYAQNAYLGFCQK